MYIGTRPEARGRGYARKLIENITSRADKDNLPCYLESSNAVNRKIYGRMGFGLKRVIYLQRRSEGAVELDIMVREPGAQ